MCGALKLLSARRSQSNGLTVEAVVLVLVWSEVSEWGGGGVEARFLTRSCVHSLTYSLIHSHTHTHTPPTRTHPPTTPIQSHKHARSQSHFHCLKACPMIKDHFAFIFTISRPAMGLPARISAALPRPPQRPSTQTTLHQPPNQVIPTIPPIM